MALKLWLETVGGVGVVECAVGICRAGSAVTGEATGGTFVGLRFFCSVLLGPGAAGTATTRAAFGGAWG